MIAAYIYYPNPHITMHSEMACGNIRQQQKEAQRVIRIDRGTFSTTLQEFENGVHRFGADATTNDMWLEVDFNDNEFERAVVEHIRKILSTRYTPFDRITPNDHC